MTVWAEPLLQSQLLSLSCKESNKPAKSFSNALQKLAVTTTFIQVEAFVKKGLMKWTCLTPTTLVQCAKEHTWDDDLRLWGIHAPLYVTPTEISILEFGMNTVPMPTYRSPGILGLIDFFIELYQSYVHMFLSFCYYSFIWDWLCINISVTVFLYHLCLIFEYN